MKKEKIFYECETENQKYLDKLNLKSECCNCNLISNSLDEWFCENCFKEVKE